MGIEMNHPTPSHSPNTNAKLSGGHKWSNVVTNGRRTQSPTISDSFKAQSWRTATSRCQCALSIPPMAPLVPIEGLDIAVIVHYAHKLGDFARAHNDFEQSKEEWTPQMFGRVLQLISDAKCMAMDAPLRTFHQAIRNNGLWADWIGSASPYPHFEKILLQELGEVIENLSPKYLKDIKIDHLLKIFPAHGECGEVELRGKKRKLKRQVLKWCETQSEEILNREWSKINVLKWRLQEVIDKKDLEMEQRMKEKQSFHNNWRSNNPSPVQAYSRHSTNTSPKPTPPPPAPQPPRFSLADKSIWPSLQANWNATPNESRLVLGM